MIFHSKSMIVVEKPGDDSWLFIILKKSNGMKSRG